MGVEKGEIVLLDIGCIARCIITSELADYQYSREKG